MANEEQLSILKQGPIIWNRWRAEHLNVYIDLSKADLKGANLRGAIFSGDVLSISDLSDSAEMDARAKAARLVVDYMRQHDTAEVFKAIKRLLNASNLSQADLRGADLKQADLSRATLNGADLSRAYLSGADLARASLKKANLSETDLFDANLTGADLVACNFSAAEVGSTIFANLDLSEVIGLENVVHHYPSIISTDTLVQSKGKIPEQFLRGCGLSDLEIETMKLYNLDLSNDEISQVLYKVHDMRAQQALQISPLFISYSHADTSFVDKMEVYLNKSGIRFWRDVHDAKSGRLEKQIDRAIRQNPIVLLILSSNSIKSDWVEHEVRIARALEQEVKRDVLCPIALDDSWKISFWPKRIMEQVMEYNILDFSAWEDESKFDGMFRRLIDGLELFYKG